MKRVWRWVFNGVVAVSLLLFLVTGTLWALHLGWRKGASLTIGFPKSFDAYSYSGEFIIGLLKHSDNPTLSEQFTPEIGLMKENWLFAELYTLIDEAQKHEMGGFGIGGESKILPLPWGDNDPEYYAAYALELPQWFVAIASGVLPAIWIARWRKKKRTMQAGLCPGCGYDLRATPDRCPECGRIPA